MNILTRQTAGGASAKVKPPSPILSGTLKLWICQPLTKLGRGKSMRSSFLPCPHNKALHMAILNRCTSPYKPQHWGASLCALFTSAYLSEPCQRRVKKRHLHVQQGFSFMYNPEVKRRGYLLSVYIL